MRVLIVSSRMPCFPASGAPTREFQLVKQLAQHHEIVCVVPCFDEQDRVSGEVLSHFCQVHLVYPHMQRSPKPEPSGRAKSKTLNRLQGIYRILFGPPNLLNGAKGLLLALEQELHQIDWESIDLFQVEHSILGGLLAGKRRDVPVVLDSYDICSSMAERQYRMAPDLKNRLFEWIEWRKVRTFERHAFRACRHLLVASEPDRERALALSPKCQVSVVPNGVDTDYFTNATPCSPEPRNLLFTGDMAYQPNVEAAAYFCVHILPLILQDLPDAKLYIAGRNPAPAVIDLVEQFPENIIVTGSVDDMRPYMERATVCVVPLLNGGGTRLKILESLSMKKAVVSTSVGCEGIEAIDGEHLIIADTPQVFAEATKKLLVDVHLREKLGRQGRIFAERKYDWRVIVPTVNGVWNELTRGNQANKAQTENL